jgi:hypothetical protein
MDSLGVEAATTLAQLSRQQLTTTIHVFVDVHGIRFITGHQIKDILKIPTGVFNYWQRKLHVVPWFSSQDQHLRKACRGVFGGRSTFAFYQPDDMKAILLAYMHSRQRKGKRKDSDKAIMEVIHHLDSIIMMNK